METLLPGFIGPWLSDLLGFSSSAFTLLRLQGALPLGTILMCSLGPFFAETPLTLSQLCRVSLRKATGVRGLEKVAKLNIPPRLIDYLSYN